MYITLYRCGGSGAYGQFTPIVYDPNTSCACISMLLSGSSNFVSLFKKLHNGMVLGQL